MATGKGSNVKCIYGEETTWATGVAGDEQIPMLSEDVSENIEVIEDSYLHGSPTSKNYQPSSRLITGNVSVEGVYDTITTDIIGIGGLIKMAFGGANWEAVPTANEFDPTDDLDIYFTMAWAKQVSVWEAVGLKVRTMEITGNAQGNIVFNFGLIGSKLLRTGDAGIVNTTSTFTGITPTVDPTLMTFDDCIIRMDAHGAALTSADQINVSSFTLAFDNGLSDPEFPTPKNGEDALYTLEPLRNAKRTVTCSFTMPRYEADTEFTAFKANTAQQIDIMFSSGSNEFNIYLPNVRIFEPQVPTPGPEILQKTFSVRALRNGTVNTDMAYQSANAISEEIGIETVNARTGAP
jgi:hypothetical protein